MNSAVKHEIKVSVETDYQPEFSDPKGGLFMFAYHIKIENHGDYAVQLLRRHWHIIDSNGEYREVQGEGVVGEQPVLEPGEQHEYSSACNLVTDMGKMYGNYEFVRLADGKLFEVDIPEFRLISPFRIN
jgi:ApaG protein